VKKNRSAAMAALIVEGLTRCCAIFSWNRRRSSLVAVSGDRPKKAANFLTLRT
jgi:hypothetical protein